jgi:hypothetical protein
MSARPCCAPVAFRNEAATPFVTAERTFFGRASATAVKDLEIPPSLSYCCPEMTFSAFETRDIVE